MTVALTLHPEWAFAVAHLGMDVINRTWRPAPEQLSEGDWLAIHAGSLVGGRRGRAHEEEALRRMLEVAESAGWRIGSGMYVERGGEVVPLSLMVRSSVVAVVRYRGCHLRRSAWSADLHSQWYWDRLVCLPRPVPCSGSAFLWALPAEVEMEVSLHLEEP